MTDRELIEEAAYVICDDSMDIADRGSIPQGVWDSAMDAAAALFQMGMLRPRSESGVMTCPIKGTAAIRQHIDVVAGGIRIEWTQADPEIHIDPELLEDEGANYQIKLTYDIGELCPYGFGYHARRRTP